MNPSTNIVAQKAASLPVAEKAIALPANDMPSESVATQSDETPLQPVKKSGGYFDSFVAKVRDKSPNWVVNSGSQLSFGFKVIADGLSVWSSVRKGSSSPWRLGGSLVTFGTGVLGTIISEKKVSEEKQEDYAQMSRWKYFCTKTQEAFNPKDHIVETSGLALIINGFCVMMSGIKQSSKNQKSWEALQGPMTALAGMIMTYMPDRERAWQIAHTTFMIRSVPSALHARDAYFKGNMEANPPVHPGDWQTGAKWISNQIANIIGTLYGGVKKLPDGSIIHIGKKGEDVTAPKQSRRLVAARDASYTSHTITEKYGQTPDTKISGATPHEKLMGPTDNIAERVAV